MPITCFVLLKYGQVTASLFVLCCWSYADREWQTSLRIQLHTIRMLLLTKIWRKSWRWYTALFGCISHAYCIASCCIKICIIYTVYFMTPKNTWQLCCYLTWEAVGEGGCEELWLGAAEISPAGKTWDGSWWTCCMFRCFGVSHIIFRSQSVHKVLQMDQKWWK